MDDISTDSAVRWGGRAGLLGGLSMLAVFAFLAVFVGLETLEGEAELRRFLEVKPYRIVENTFHLLTVALWTVHAAALFVALRSASFAAALMSGVFMGLGLSVLAAGAVPHTATAPIAEFYHAPDALPEQQQTLVAIWAALQGVTDMFVVTGLALIPIGMGFFGVAMMRAPHYGRALAWTSLALALAGAVAAVRILIVPDDVAAIDIFALVFFNIIIGWRSSVGPARAEDRPMSRSS